MGYALASVLPSWLRRPVGGAAEHSSHWQYFRQAARSTAYYKQADFVERRRLALADFYRHHAQFLNAAAGTPPPVTFESPWDASALSVVSVDPWFRWAAPVETLVSAQASGALPVPQGSADILAAPVSVLAALLRSAAAPGYGVLALTGFSRPSVTPAVRDAVWNAWRVPVFEQFRGFQGELLGAECEAFDGLHFDPDRVVWEEAGSAGYLVVTSLVNLRHPAWRLETGRSGQIDRASCRCGSDLPRIRAHAAGVSREKAD